MNIARPATFLCRFPAFLPLIALGVAALGAPNLAVALAAPVAKAKVPANAQTLSFDVTARVMGLGQLAGPQQVVQAKVWLRGGAARVESSSGGAPAVVLFTPPYIYRLLPLSKAGVRWKIPPRQPSVYADFDPQQLLRDPAKLKGVLLRGGAKIVGRGALSGTPVEIYEAKNFGKRGQKAKVWLRRSDSLPVRLEASNGQSAIVASWRNYARPKLAAALFSSPPSYRVRNLATAPPFSAL